VNKHTYIFTRDLDEYLAMQTNSQLPGASDSDLNVMPYANPVYMSQRRPLVVSVKQKEYKPNDNAATPFCAIS
jgi:hypothetical protein